MAEWLDIATSPIPFVSVAIGAVLTDALWRLRQKATTRKSCQVALRQAVSISKEVLGSLRLTRLQYEKLERAGEARTLFVSTPWVASPKVLGEFTEVAGSLAQISQECCDAWRTARSKVEAVQSYHEEIRGKIAVRNRRSLQAVPGYRDEVDGAIRAIHVALKAFCPRAAKDTQDQISDLLKD